MILRTSGTVLGVRESTYAARDTGEIKTNRTLDLYDPEDGPAELRLPEGIEVPEPGTQVEVKVTVRAFSGFVKETRSGEGVAGDAKVQYTVVAIERKRARAAA